MEESSTWKKEKEENHQLDSTRDASTSKNKDLALKIDEFNQYFSNLFRSADNVDWLGLFISHWVKIMDSFVFSSFLWISWNL